MTRFKVSMVAIVMLLACAAVRAQAPDDAAQAAAESWLKIVDTGNYGSSYEETATVFKSAMPREKWTAALAGARAPLGGLTSRTLVSREGSEQLPGAPPGKYFTIRFTSAFANAPKASETVMLMLDGDRGWRVVGFTIRPD